MRLRRATAKSAAEKHYPLIMEDLDDLLKGVGDWTTITADLHYRAATALREAEEQARRYWLIEEDISWRPEVGIENCPSWRLLKRLLRRNTLLQKQLLKDPMISWTDESHVEQPVTVFLEAANEQLMRFSYRKFASQQEPRSLRISRILRNKGLPTLGIGWREELWVHALKWEFELWIKRIYDRLDKEDRETGDYSQRSFDTIIHLLPFPGKGTPMSQEAEEQRTTDFSLEKDWDTLVERIRDRRPSIAWNWLRMRGVTLSSHEWVRFLFDIRGLLVRL